MQDFSYRTKLKLSVVDPDPETLSQVWGGGGGGGGAVFLPLKNCKNIQFMLSKACELDMSTLRDQVPRS